MQEYKLLFKAPFDFAQSVMDQYRERFDMDEVGQPDILVCDPKAAFVIDENYLKLFPMLKILATPSTGTNHIDLEACKRAHVKVLSLLDDRPMLDSISASAEFTFKLLLDALRMPPGRELQYKVVGLVGYGRIGKRMEKYCTAFGALVYKNDPNIFGMELGAMFRECDAVVICCALNDDTRGMITRELIASMRKGAALINTARGEIIDEDGLVAVMKERPDLRVAVDVLVGETTGTQNPKRMTKLGAIVTNHVAGETFDSRTKAAKILLGLIERTLDE
jgi:lactate dehydrogenase-like 2-hydroxyacid dehydrogenase